MKNKVEYDGKEEVDATREIQLQKYRNPTSNNNTNGRIYVTATQRPVKTTITMEQRK